MSYIRKSFLFVLMAKVQAFEGSGDETQIDQTPVDLEDGPTPEPVFNCWSCTSESSFDSCLENGQIEYCNQGNELVVK